MTAAIIGLVTIGVILAFALGFACRAFGIPSRAPPLILGALLVMTMETRTGRSVANRYQTLIEEPINRTCVFV